MHIQDFEHRGQSIRLHESVAGNESNNSPAGELNAAIARVCGSGCASRKTNYGVSVPGRNCSRAVGARIVDYYELVRLASQIALQNRNQCLPKCVLGIAN